MNEATTATYLPAETYHHISGTDIALFTHLFPCGVQEAVHIIEGLLKNTSELFRHLMRAAISMRKGVISSATLLKRLRSGSHKNATYTTPTPRFARLAV